MILNIMLRHLRIISFPNILELNRNNKYFSHQRTFKYIYLVHYWSVRHWVPIRYSHKVYLFVYSIWVSRFTCTCRAGNTQYKHHVCVCVFVSCVRTSMSIFTSLRRLLPAQKRASIVLRCVYEEEMKKLAQSKRWLSLWRCVARRRLLRCGVVCCKAISNGIFYLVLWCCCMLRSVFSVLE